MHATVLGIPDCMTDTTKIDPSDESKGLGADTPQSDDERAEAIEEFHTPTGTGPGTLDGDEATDQMSAEDEGKTLPTPDPQDRENTDPKTTFRQE